MTTKAGPCSIQNRNSNILSGKVQLAEHYSVCGVTPNVCGVTALRLWSNHIILALTYCNLGQKKKGKKYETTHNTFDNR